MKEKPVSPCPRCGSDAESYYMPKIGWSCLWCRAQAMGLRHVPGTEADYEPVPKKRRSGD